MATGQPQSGNRVLLEWKDTLPWQRDNEYILTGYRKANPSITRAVESIGEVHNETANIWSHMLGAFQFLFGLAQFVRLRVTDFSSDSAVVSLYYFCVIVCFVLSTAYHTLSDHSAEIHRLGNELDHLGIVMVIWGTGISGAHFALYCDSTARNAYFIILTSTALGCAIFTLQPKFRRPTYRTMRFLMYCFLGSSIFAPLVHGIYRLGFVKLRTLADLDSFLSLAAINFAGAAIYAARVPERWIARRLDLFGQSHNLMHILVWTGALVRLNGLLNVIHRIDGQGERFCNSAS